MRITITLFILLCFFLPSFGQEISKNIELIAEADVPFEILERQHQLFPFTLVSKWQVQKKDRGADSPNLRFIGMIEKDGNSNLSASYLPNGVLLFTSESILSETIPDNILLDIKKENPKFKIKASDLITLTLPKKEIYLVKLLDNNLLQYVFYDTSGKEMEKNNLPVELMMLLR